MDVFSANLWTILATVFTLAVLVYTWMHWMLSYWTRRGVPQPSSFFMETKRLLAQNDTFAEFTVNKYEYFKRQKAPHGGFYFLWLPTYMPVNLDIIKSIMQNDFNHFVDRGVYFDEEADPLSAHLFSLEGAKWRNLRMKLTPTFTSGKMRMMFETLVKCADQLHEEMDKSVGGDAINIKDMLARFTTDIIGNCAFGIDCNSIKDPDNEFTSHLDLFFRKDVKDNFIGFLTFIAPKFMRKFGTKVINPICSKFFMRLISETVQYREEHNVFRKDFMHLLLQLKNRGKLADDENVLSDDAEDKAVTLSFNEIAAQAFIFFLAGFETSSTTMTFCLFELSVNEDVQEKLREEVNQVLAKYDNQITYDALMEMHYMEKVINETLRKYPPLPALNRNCTKEYKVPGTDIILEKDTRVVIPVLGIQRDPEYYPDPEKFDPERFSDGVKKDRHPYAFLPFGEGPRICIGLRFGMMQTKVGLTALLKNYKFALNSKTSMPIEFDPRSFILTTQGGIWLDYKKI